MAYEALSFPSFGAGLNLLDKVDAVSEEEAIDLLNVEFGTRGAVAQRSGYDEFNASALTARAASLAPFETTSGTRQLVAGCGSRLEALNTSGTVVASATGLTDAVWDFTRFGAPGTEYLYAGNGTDTIRRWDGSSWTAPSGMPKAGALAVMAVDQGNRMVAGGFGVGVTDGGPTGAASSSNPSRVYFSDPGAPETWGTNNYIDFTPGDGERVQAIIAWQAHILIFKETKFFEVYGTSEDVGGDPIFQYYTIDTGVGLASPRAVAADETGVYFLDRTGVYRVSGRGEPAPASRAIDPIFLGGSSRYFQGGELSAAFITNCAMASHADRIYLAYPTSSPANNRVLVYDAHGDWWSLWDLPAAALASFRIGSSPELVFAGASGDNDIYRLNSTFTNDNGSAITSRWQSGWFNYQLPIVKTIRETKVWGSGKVTLGVARDYRTTFDSSALVDLTDPVDGTNFGGTGNFGGSGYFGDEITTLNAALRRVAVRGAHFSTYLQNSTLDQSWAVHQLTHHLRESRTPSVRTGVPA